MSAKIRLDVTGKGIGTRVWIDDREIEGLAAVHLQITPDGSRIFLTFLSPSIEVVGDIGAVEETRQTSKS